MLRHFKFVGGPWDGEYHEVDTKRHYHHLLVPHPSKVSFKRESLEEPVLNEDGEPVLNEDGEPVSRMIKPEFKHTRYTLRHMAGEGGNVYWYAPDNWPDMYTISQLIHHYQGRP